MNENIRHYLDEYVKHPDPQYAVFIKGKWGCGKSFFIHRWMKEYEQEAEGNKMFKPIYVSLYGLNSTEQITRAIDTVLHPFLYSKGAKYIKNVLNVAGKIVFKTSFDLDGNGKDDTNFQTTLDSLSLLTKRDTEAIGNKLIVFDDLERSLIDMKMLLGYINNFVEHGACHVIIVGDETHIQESEQSSLYEFKEKTIGREFEIVPDTEAAIDYFLTDDLPLDDWTKGQRRFIIELFSLTGYKNLRILRQCLYDFSGMLQSLNCDITDKYKTVLLSLLASYIVVYFEYKGDNRDLIKGWNWMYCNGVSGDEKIKERISSLQKKYNSFCLGHSIDVLNMNHIQEIVSGIETGKEPVQYVQQLVGQVSHNQTVQDKAADFMHLTKAEMDSICQQMVHDINEGSISNLYLMGRTLKLLAFFDAVNIYWFPEATKALFKASMIKAYHSAMTQEELYEMQTAYRQGLISFMSGTSFAIMDDVNDYLENVFRKYEIRLPNAMSEALTHLSDANVSKLSELDQKPKPDGQSAYELSAIFKGTDPNVLVNNLLGMSNNGLCQFMSFLAKHYKLGFICNGLPTYIADDAPVLEDVYDKLKVAAKERVGLDRFVWNKLLGCVEAAVKRVKG